MTYDSATAIIIIIVLFIHVCQPSLVVAWIAVMVTAIMSAGLSDAEKWR